MAYKLYLDKPEVFECEVSVKNASLKNSLARLVVESSSGVNFVFNGKIENERCTVPIRRLKGLLEENSDGKMHLEIIVEDTYFQPWKSDFVVEEHTSIKVRVNESKQSTKPLVEVKVPTSQNPVMKKELLPLYEISKICEKFGITRSNIKAKRKEFYQIINEYFNENPEFSKHRSIILEGLCKLIK